MIFPQFNLRKTWVITLVCFFSAIPFSKSSASGWTGVSIKNQSPINISCGGTATLTVEISYFRDEGDKDEHKELLGVYQYNSCWFDNWLSYLSVNMPTATGNGKFTVDFTLTCDVQVSGKCEFSGSKTTGSGQSPHLIYAQIGDAKSAKVTVNCKKPDGTLCYVIPKEDHIYQGGSSVIALAVKSPVRPVKEIDLLVSQDASSFSLTQAAFSSEFLKGCISSNIDKSMPGKIRFRAVLRLPKVITVQTTIASYTIQSHTNLAFGPYMINVDTASKLFDPSKHFIDAHLGEQTLAVVPEDKKLPVINNALLLICDQFLRGQPGSVQDDFLSQAGYAEIGLYENENIAIGSAKANKDGSFLIEGLHIKDGASLKLVATDLAEHKTVYKFKAAIADGCIGNPITKVRAGKTLTGTVTNDEGYKETTFKSPNGSLTLYTTADQELLQTGKTLRGTVVAEPAGKTQKEKDDNFQELKKLLLTVGETVVSITDIEQSFNYSGKRSPDDHFYVSLSDRSGQNRESLGWRIPKEPVSTYIGGSGTMPEMFMNEKLILGDKLIALHAQPASDAAFSETDHFSIRDSRGKTFSLSPKAQSTSTSVLEIPDAAAKGKIFVSRSREGKKTEELSFYNADLELSSPNTNLKKGEKSIVSVRIHIEDERPIEQMSFRVALSNVNPNIVNMEGGNLQVISFPAQVDRWTIKREIEGVVPGVFAVNATLVSDLDNSNDPFAAEKEVLNDPESFNRWIGALKKDLAGFAAAQPNDARGNNRRTNANRAIENLMNCDNSASLDECKKIADELLTPLQIPKGAATCWQSSYEAMRAASKQLAEKVSGKEALVNWPLIQGGLELARKMGDELKDDALTNDAEKISDQLPMTWEEDMPKSKMEDINRNLQGLMNKCDGKMNGSNHNFLRYSMQDLLRAGSLIERSGNASMISPIMVGYLDPFRKELWVDPREKPRILGEFNAQRQANGKYRIFSTNFEGTGVNYLVDVKEDNPEKIFILADERDNGLPLDIDKTRKETGGKKEEGKPIGVGGTKTSNEKLDGDAKKKQDEGIPLDLKKKDEDDGIPLDILFTPKYGGTFTDSTGSSYHLWKRSRCTLEFAGSPRHTMCMADGQSVFDTEKNEFRFIPNGNFYDEQYNAWWRCKGGHTNETCTDKQTVIGVKYIYSDRNCTKLVNVMPVTEWACK